MVGRDTVTFKFRLDAKEMQRLIKALEADAKRFGGTMERVKGQSDNLSNGIKNSGNNAAAAAVNFQTATQGMLNLSTAAVQTFTSISNLDRAANRLAQSKLGVARATDLLNNKELRLSELQEKGLGTSRKAGLLTNEIATARADLAVKTDKARIEEGALLDIQLLFVTNIANVMISSIQTIKTLRDMQAMSTIKATVAEKLLTSSFITNNIVARTSAGSIKGMSFAVKGLTFSVRGLMLALGPIAILITGVTIAMQAYEENWGGFKDAVQTALPFLKESNDELDNANDILENGRVNLDDYSASVDNLGNSMKKLSTPHKQYLEMMRDAHLQMDSNSKLAAFYSSQLAGIRTSSQGFSTPSVGGGLPSSGGVSIGGTGTGVVSTAVSSGGVGTPSTSAQASSSPLVQLADPQGTNQQRFIFSQLPREQQANIVLAKAESLRQEGFAGAANILFAQAIEIQSKPIIETDPVKALKNIMVKGTGFFGGAPTGPQARTVDQDAQKFRFGIDIASREGISPSSNRGIVLNKTGRDIGKIGDLVSVNEGIRLANLETTMSQFRQATPGMTGGRSGGRTDLALAALDKSGEAGREMSEINDMVSKNVFRTGSNYFGEGFFKSTGATAAYQVPRGSIRASDEFYARIAEQDRLANLRRFGGYSSRKAQSEAGKRAQSEAFKEAQRFMFSFGFTGIKKYSGHRDLIGQLGRVSQQAHERRTALSSAGLSYKTFNSSGLPYRHTAHQYNAHIAQRDAVWSYNNNQLAKAGLINMLEQDFGATGFVGSALSLPSLQEAVAHQDQLIKSIGLDRTEAFQIVDTVGRGREEIDDRVRFKDRLSSMSTGVSVL